MLPIAGVLALASSPIAKWLGAGIAITICAGWAYLAIDARAVSRCERGHQVASLQALEAANTRIAKANARADEISRNWVVAQRRIEGLKGEYLAYAHGITGNCPADLGLLTSAASRGEAIVPETTGEPANPPVADGSADIAARVIGVNVATNYARFKECLARYDALLDWHEEAVK